MTRHSRPRDGMNRDIGADDETRTDEEVREESAPDDGRDQGALLDVDANLESNHRRDRDAERDRPIAG